MADLDAESRLLIDGKLADAASGATFANVNPATEDVAGHVADAGAGSRRMLARIAPKMSSASRRPLMTSTATPVSASIRSTRLAPFAA